MTETVFSVPIMELWFLVLSRAVVLAESLASSSLGAFAGGLSRPGLAGTAGLSVLGGNSPVHLL